MSKILVIILAALGLQACTFSQRYDMFKQARLDECAMQRMTTDLFPSGQATYQQAFDRCHQTVISERARQLFAKNTPSGATSEGLPLSEGPSLPVASRPKYDREIWECLRGLMARDYGVFAPDDAYAMDGTTLVRVFYIINNTDFNSRWRLSGDEYKYDSSLNKCDVMEHFKIRTFLGMELHRRYPYGIPDKLRGHQ